MEIKNEEKNELTLTEKHDQEVDMQLKEAKRIGKDVLIGSFTAASVSWLGYQFLRYFKSFVNVLSQYKNQKKESE